MPSYVVGSPAGIWMQFANLSFFLAGLFGDLLIIRFFLLLGYVWLIIFALTGLPLWPNATAPKEPFVLSVDTLVWSALGFWVHASSFVRLILDERPLQFSEEEDALWRMFYRYSGISKVIFKNNLLRNGKFETYEKGAILTDENSEFGNRNIYIVLDGHVEAKLSGSEETTLQFYSGEIFEFKHLNLLGIHIGFLQCTMTARVVSPTCRVFTIPITKFEAMAKGSAPMREAWQAVTLSALSRLAERQTSSSTDSTSSGQSNIDLARSAVFSPLEDHELPPQEEPGSGECFRSPVSHFLYLLRVKFSPPFPFMMPVAGLRHGTTPPPIGAAAANVVKTGASSPLRGQSSSANYGATSIDHDETRVKVN